MFICLTLEEYIRARSLVCIRNHKKPCNECDGLIRVASEIREKGFLKLSEVFKLCSPQVKYKPVEARRKLLQIPLAVVGMGTLKEQYFFVYI